MTKPNGFLIYAIEDCFNLITCLVLQYDDNTLISVFSLVKAVKTISILKRMFFNDAHFILHVVSECHPRKYMASTTNQDGATTRQSLERKVVCRQPYDKQTKLKKLTNKHCGQVSIKPIQTLLQYLMLALCMFYKVVIQGVHKVFRQFYKFIKKFKKCYQNNSFYIFLWGYVKDVVYRTKVKDISDLKERITAAVNTIDEEMLRRTWTEIEYRLDILRATNGAHIEIY